MRQKANVSIAIRSFDTSGKAFKRLSSHFNIVFINTSGRRIEGAELCRALESADGVIAGTEQYTKQVIDASPNLKAISRVGVGTNAIDLQLAKEHGIRILNTPDAPGIAVAEHTIALLLASLKNIPQFYERMHKGDSSLGQGRLLHGKTAGIIGMGRIGRRVSVILDSFGCRIIFYDPWVKDGIPAGWKKTDSMDELVAESDIISIHAAPQDDQQPLITNEALEKCRRGVIIINTARASLLDERALVAAIEEGTVSSACLDVVSKEPYNGPLLQYPQVLITPHVASNTLESRAVMEMEAVENLIQCLGGNER